jgi:hypothetical protein
MIMRKKQQNNDLRLMEPPVSKPIRSISLKSPLHVQRFLAKLLNQMRRGEVLSNEGTKQAYVAGLLLRSFETLQMEARIAEIEKKISQSDEA